MSGAVIRITLELRDDERSRAFAERLTRIEKRLNAVASHGESWMKISILGDEVNARLSRLETL